MEMKSVTSPDFLHLPDYSHLPIYLIYRNIHHTASFQMFLAFLFTDVLRLDTDETTLNEIINDQVKKLKHLYCLFLDSNIRASDVIIAFS
jgi:hypothetical protein